MVKQCNKHRPDVLGDRMKGYESITTKTTLMPNAPVYARIDGRAFHTLTRGFNKPFDTVFTSIMQSVCHKLVEDTGAILGYVQSDEISLGWEDYTKAPFDGKLFKLESVLASMATAFFYQGIISLITDEALDNEDTGTLKKLWERGMCKAISFDCRIFNVPSMEELANAFLWRENDAIRNSISSLAQANFSHKQLQNKSSSDMQNMLLTEKGINWNNMHLIDKRGTYMQKRNYEEYIPDEIWDKIPDSKKPENRMCIRSKVIILDVPIMKKVLNKVGTYFYQEAPLFLDNSINV